MQIFKNVFGDSSITLPKEYVNYNPQQDFSVSLSHIERENSHFLQGKEYLMDMLLLCMCNSFVSARTSGTNGVMMLTENFEHTYFFNLGRYGMISLD